MIAGILIILAAGFYAGYRLKPEPEVSTVTRVIFKYDTIHHYIKVSGPAPDPDTVLMHDTIPEKVDTAAILQAHYSKYVYTRPFADSLIEVSLRDTVTQNKIITGQFSYKLLRPQEVINQTTTNQTVIYNKYLAAGISLNTYDMGFTGLDLIYNGPEWYAGAGYMPGVKGINIKAGRTILKFKSR